MSEADQTKLAPQQRSPAFPYISLDVALDRVAQIYREVRDHAQPREVMAKAYGKPPTSSATLQTFATLLQYGLFENVSTNSGRKLRVSTLAQTILNPHAPTTKVMDGRKEAALNPTIFKELWERFGDTTELNESVPLYYLTDERKSDGEGVFTDKAARDVLRVYQATLAFAGITGADKVKGPAGSALRDALPQQELKVGDFVQVEINGAFQLDEPKRVEEIREHEGKLWVFLAGEKAAVPMTQTILVGQPTQDLGPPIREQPPSTEKERSLPKGWIEETLIDDGGEEIKLRYQGKATVERYAFIRDYLDFKIKRLAAKPN
jgi:hypothetical protein